MEIKPMEIKKKYGFYSEKQAESIGTVIYRNEHGKEVECSEISTNPDGCSCDDKVALGEVFGFVRPGRKGKSKYGIIFDR